LFVLCAYLLVWVPANFALLASAALPSLSVRSPVATLELMAHAVVTLACAVSGWMLRVRNAAGRPVATAALVANAIATAQSLHASALPHDVPPGLAAPLALAAFTNAAVWTMYLYTSRRLRRWLAP
jgi:hypothetical protein